MDSLSAHNAKDVIPADFDTSAENNSWINTAN